MEAEQACWSGKHTMTGSDAAAEREFSRILHAYLSPQAAIQAAMGHRAGPTFRLLGDQALRRPGRRAALADGLRRAEQMEAGQ